jgi:hypothetical protein
MISADISFELASFENTNILSNQLEESSPVSKIFIHKISSSSNNILLLNSYQVLVG